MTECRRVALVLLVVTLIWGAAHSAAAPASSPNETAIRKVLDTQVADWNRGDVTAFMQGYKNSPATTFVGKTVEHGYASILRRYQEKYGSKEQMGMLSFDGLEVNALDVRYATVTGRFHLTRSKEAGGNADGIFSLVFEKTSAGWKIVLDHTS